MWKSGDFFNIWSTIISAKQMLSIWIFYASSMLGMLQQTK